MEPPDVYDRQTDEPMIKLPEAMTPKRSHGKVKLLGKQYTPDFHSATEAVQRAQDLYAELYPIDSVPTCRRNKIEGISRWETSAIPSPSYQQKNDGISRRETSAIPPLQFGQMLGSPLSPVFVESPQRSADLSVELVTTHAEVPQMRIPPPPQHSMLHFPFWKGRYGWLFDSGSSCDIVEHASLPPIGNTYSSFAKDIGNS